MRGLCRLAEMGFAVAPLRDLTFLDKAPQSHALSSLPPAVYGLRGQETTHTHTHPPIISVPNGTLLFSELNRE